MKIRYTLIIPHYNIPHLLERLLNTIPRRDDLQIIVVDDCSTKGLDKMKCLKDKFDYVEWIDLAVNGGGGRARNIGIEKAKGEYLIFADADDYFAAGFGTLLDCMFTEDLVIFNVQGIFTDTNQFSERVDHVNSFIQLFNKNRNEGELKLRYLFGEPWGRLIKKSIIDEFTIRFDETKIHNDTTFAYLLGWHAHDIRVISEVYYFVTDRSTSVSKNTRYEAFSVRTENFAKKNRFLKEKNIPIFDEIILSPLIIYIKKFKITHIFEYFKTIDNEGLSAYDICKKLINRTLISLNLSRNIKA